ncbi:MAG: HesA/MoeB/ThiF family protein [Pseudomonadota bacterium]
MLFFLAVVLGLWVLGVLTKTPVQARLLMIALVYVVVLALQVILPDGHPVRLLLGESLAEWLVLGVGVAAVVLYFRAVRGLKHRAAQVTADDVPQAASGQGVELERNARHILLREIGGPGQGQLKSARVLVVGAGGLGSPALSYLGAAGVGLIGVIDSDVVENSNLQRQIIHADADIGVPKVFSAQKAIEAQNPFVTVRPYNRRLTADIAEDLIRDYDLVLDGSDNFETRYLVNETCVALGKPLIAAALTQWEGQLSLFDPAGGAPCYSCVFPTPPDPSLVPTCAEAGVLGPLPGVVGAMMAVEAIKEITGAGTSLRGQMAIYDALHGESRRIAIKRRADCTVCGGI